MKILQKEITELLKEEEQSRKVLLKVFKTLGNKLLPKLRNKLFNKYLRKT